MKYADINKVSTYTHEQLRSSLEAYRLFHDGYVRDVEDRTINDLSVVRSKVMHSTYVNKKSFGLAIPNN